MIDRLKKHLLIIGTVAITVFILLITLMPQFSGFAASMLKITIGGGLYFALDQYVMKDIDTIEELRKGNVAYAVFMLGYAVLLAAAIASE